MTPAYASRRQRTVTLFWRHEQSQVSLSGKWAAWWSQPSPPFWPGTAWQGKWAPRRFTALVGVPRTQNVVLHSWKTQPVPHSQEWPGHWDTYVRRNKTNPEESDHAEPDHLCIQMMSEGKSWVRSQAWQSDGLWSPNNLVGNKPLWPRWQLHLSSPYQCPESLVTVTICTCGPERSRLTLHGRAWRDPLGSSDCFGTQQDCRCLDGPWWKCTSQ